MPKTVADSPPLRQDVDRVYYLVGVPRVAMAKLVLVSEGVSVKMVIPPNTRGTDLRARQVCVWNSYLSLPWFLFLHCLTCSGRMCGLSLDVS